MGRTIRGVEKASIHLAVLFVFLYASNLAGQITTPSAAPRGPTEIPGIYIVTLRQGVPASEKSAIVRGAGANARLDFEKTNALSVEVPNAAALARLRNDPRVLSVFANHLYYLPANGTASPGTAGVGRAAGQSDAAVTADNPTIAAAASTQVVPDGVNRIGAAPGMLTWTGAGVGVAVVDTGLDFSHPDLGLNPEVVGVNSFNALGGSCQDIHGHGTHLAGIIAARNNLIDVVGVAPGATLYCVNVFQPDPIYEVVATDESLIAALEWIAAHANLVSPPIRVVNMSLGRPSTPDDTPANPLHVIVKALHDSGISVVVSAGNDATVEVSDMVPANYPEVMAVASTSVLTGVNGYDLDLFTPCTGEQSVLADSASYFSTDGAFIGGVGVTISAPGETQEDIFELFGSCFVQSTGILSTWPGGQTMEASGTSMSAPHVSGVVALMWQKELSQGHSLAPESARTRIRANAIRPGTAPLDSEVDGYTFDGQREGVIWAPSAVGDAPPPQPNLPPTVTISSPANGSTFSSATLISFAGVATDPEQGSLSGSLIWTSDRQGQIGTGASFSRALNAGTHTITATVTDSGGNVVRPWVTITVVASPQSDMVVTAVSAPATAAAGSAIAVTDTTKNQGTGSADASVTRFYLSINTVLDASDVPLGERSVGNLIVGQISSGSTTVTIPAATTGGSYYVIAKADAADVLVETLENNNTRYDPIQIGPDLVVSALSVPTTAAAGGTMAVTDTTKNQGVGAADSFVTRFYLSTNTTFDAGDAVLGERTILGLAASQTSSGSTSVTIPAGTTSGTYYIIAKADPDNAVPETVETNNTKYDSTQIGPDLLVSALTVPATAGAGATITVTDTTKNQGAGSANPSITRFYLSTNTTFDASDVALGERVVPTLASGQTNSGSTSVTIPAGTTAGTHYIIGKADADSVVPETVETNNTKYGSTKIGPDLAVSALTVPATAGAGSTITVTDTIKNQGAGSANPSITRFYLSTNSALDASDVALGSRTVPGLAAGQTSSGSALLTIPAGTPGGPYVIIAKADADNTVGETVETNNTRTASTKIGPDLIVSAFTAPSKPAAGAAITVTDTTKNQGAGSANPCITRFYLSTNTTFDASDVALGERAVPTLLSGQTNSDSTSVTIPAGTIAGTYYIIAKADPDNTVGETVETNNTRTATVRVTAP
ncbi:MAG: S8 family serine peptidase [Acidobacteria bacterium]|nr:S8 family serine peptidase [Acidobacteriota bacterium]